MDSERAPWIIGGAIVLAGFLIAVAVFLSRGGADAPQAAAPVPAASRADPVSPAEAPSPVDASVQDAKAQHSLRAALQAAQGVVTDTGSFASAGSFELAQALPQYTYSPGVRESGGPDEISLSTTAAAWAASARSESGTCFWIKDTIDETRSTTVTTYGVGEPCSGNAAMLSATSRSWPG